MPPFFVGAGQFSPVSGAVRGAAAGAQSAPARPPAQAGGWAGFAGAARKTAAAPPPGFHLRRRGRIPQKAGQAIATLRFPLQSAARHGQSHLRAPPLAIASLHAGAVRRGRRRARKARPPVRRPRPAGGLVLRAQPAKPPPPRPRASTCVGGGAYPKSHRVKLLPQKRKKVANCHFFAMRYP